MIKRLKPNKIKNRTPSAPLVGFIDPPHPPPNYAIKIIYNGGV